MSSDLLRKSLNQPSKSFSSTSSSSGGGGTPNTSSAASRLGNSVKESTNANYNKEVLQAPPALSKILQKIQVTEAHLLTSTKRIDKKSLNERLSTSLFLSKIDPEEVKSAVNHIDYDIYEAATYEGRLLIPRERFIAASKSKYDEKKEKFVVQTKLMVVSDEVRQQPGQKVDHNIPPQKAEIDHRDHLPPSKLLNSNSRPISSARPKSKEGRPKSKEGGRPKSSSRQQTPSHHLHHHHHPHNQVLHGENGEYGHAPHKQHIHHKHYLTAQNIPFLTSIDDSPVPITKQQAEKYFGDKAKVLFYEQYRKLCYHLQHIAPHGANSTYLRQQYLQQQQESEDESGDNSTITTQLNSSNVSLLGDESVKLEKPSTASTQKSSVNGEALENGGESVAKADNEESQEFDWKNMSLDPSQVKHYFHGKDDASIYIPPYCLSESFKEKLEIAPPIYSSDETVKSSFSTKSLSKSIDSLSQSFFQDLQSLVCNESMKHKIDQKIIRKDAFKATKGAKRKFSQSSQSDQSESTMKSSKSKQMGYKHGQRIRRYTNSKVTLDPIPLQASKTSPSPLSLCTPRSEAPEDGLDLLNSNQPISPRTKFLTACIRDGIKPLPHIILRSKMITTLKLSHCNMGDAMGRILAECIQDLPYVDSIDLNDNNLTDDSLQYLIVSIINIKTLKELNLSRNKIDGFSSEALSEYVSRPDCPIVRLTLQSADIDDGECDDFVQSLVSNEVLEELDLSANLLGSAEMASQNDPSIRTGGQAIAEYISSTSCRLKVLKLAWNAIRLRSAVTLMKAISCNHTITYLDLNNNGLGYLAGEYLGDALLENRTLQTLLVNNNNLSSTAIISICTAIVENLALKHIEMNENPIGIVGARMIMQVSIALGSRIELHAKNCNTITQDERCWYDPSKICREYELDLSQPFHRAIAFSLLNNVASHSTLVFQSIQYEPVPNSGKLEKLRLVQSIAKDRELYFDHEQKLLVQGLRLLQKAASNQELGTKLFYEADADGSGKLDKDELQEVLAKIGFEIEEDRLNDIMAIFDVDGAGTIDLSEFLQLLKVQQREAILRIKEMVEYPILSLPSQQGVKYIPPKVGKLYCKVIDGFVQKTTFYTISSIDQKHAYNMAKGIGDVTLMTEAVQNTKIRFDEGYKMYKTLYKEMHDKADVLLRVLPLMMNPFENRNLVSKATNDEIKEMARVKLAFGIALRPMFGNYNGYYILDLSREIHRVCLSRLLEQSQTLNSKRIARSIIAPGKVGDISQHGNWSCFRNEIFNGELIEINPKNFTPMPTSGILEFDFSSCERPTGQEMKISDKKLLKVLHNLVILPTEQYHDALYELEKWSKKCRLRNRDNTLFMPAYAFDVTKAVEVGHALDEFYDRLLERQELCKVSMSSNTNNRRGNVQQQHFAQPPPSQSAETETTPQNTEAEGQEANPASETTNEGNDQPPQTQSADDASLASEQPSLAFSQESQSQEGSHEGEGEEEEDGSSNDDDSSTKKDEDDLSQSVDMSPEDEANLRKRRILEQKQRLTAILYAKRGFNKHAKAQKFVEVIDETISQLWILSRHLALIVKLFKVHFDDLGKSEIYGSYAVDIVVSLIPRVIDLHNIEIIYELLTAKECAALFGRVGWLTLFNPLKPEVTYELAVHRREERIIAKIIVYLSVDEPGINLTFKQFQWNRDLDHTPGWDVTDAWMTDSGMASHGYFTVTYYSGEGRNKFGCIPNVFLRKALCQLVLLDENEIIDEDEMLPEEFVNSGLIECEQHKDIWIDYLINHSSLKK